MAWTWVSDFPNSEGIYERRVFNGNDGALYVDGVGFISQDIQTGPGSYSRIVGIQTKDYSSSFSATEVNTITINYDYTIGAVVAGGLTALTIEANSDGGPNPSTTVAFSGMVNGSGQTAVLNANILDCTGVYVWIRCSNQNGPAYSGSVTLNSVTITGGGTNPFDNHRSFVSPKKYIDDQGGAAAGGAGGAAGGNPASISADGLYIYIASFDTLNHPILIKIATALDVDGSKAFEPGAGGRIGVQCERSDADAVWVAGQFDGTNTVEKSEDAGSSFTVKDDGTFGTIRTFLVGPTDDRVLLFDGDNGDIIESTNGGDSWTTVNAAVSQLLNAVAVSAFDKNEIASVNQGAANNSVNYSLDSGESLVDYQTGVYPATDGTKILVK